MNKIASVAIACALAVTSIVPASAGSGVMPTIWSASKAEKPTLETVQYRRHYRHGYGRHHRRHYHRHHGGYGAAAAAGIIGLGLGAAIASSARPRYYDDGPYGGSDWHAYCASKYRSYDPRSGTFLGYDGYRHPCR